jgi:arylsulfatase A-like enzyme
MANVDVLPTFVTLAGGQVPANPVIDGRDISALLLGTSKDSPHAAYFYFRSQTLEAVRSGPWKLGLPPQLGAGAQKKNAPQAPVVPRLYNLDTDVGETNNVAAEHPEIVTRLQGYIAKMDADLGGKGKGPGVRPPGRVEHPKPLVKE